MAKQHRPPPLETLRDAIAEALWGAVSAPSLPAACVALGLRDGDSTEAMQSKRKYVRSRITTFKGPELLALARRVIEEFDVPDLADFVSELTTHADHRVTDLTRRAVLTELNSVGDIFGDLPVWDGVAVLSSDLEKPSLYSDRFGATLRDDIQRHYVENSDLSNFQLLELCGALTCSQQRFFDLLEKVVDPVCRHGQDQEQLVHALNKLLIADGFALSVIGEVSRHPEFGVRRVGSGVAGAPKNLIFAAVNCKPDLYFTDAINNDVAIANDSDALIYDRVLFDGGLLWASLADWWRERDQLDELAVANKNLFRRLRAAVLATNSPGEVAVFETYYARFTPRMGDKLPALIPQVYLHYDPRTAAQRGANRVLPRQRMDFLLLLGHGARIVVEVDGKHHFANGEVASPTRYAEMASEDRRLRLQGYEVYRFGAAEFSDVQRVNGRYAIGPVSTQLVESFFEKLFARHVSR
ncbi:hypothetical protein KDW10_24960 [Burkholderia vietnamiensis]|uniref:AbiJ-related protein n=1 Tax=Burkholderia vietnamiensis TaxID=60552 RepID=UPI001B8DDD60|nr:hypothetical protein [Burkholderia vietnamiensis]MBR8360578.1 hypothetical protein [Burkholderia vietnamiensis]